MDLSPTSRARVILGTIAGTFTCIAVAILVDSFSFEGLSEAQIHTALRNDIVIPLVLGGVFFSILLNKMRALAIAHQEIQRIASMDSLTAVLNRGAFTMLVEAYLTEMKRGDLPREGAFLLVDADHFKTINDTYGHQVGDEALKRIVGCIRSCVREKDLVGRVGGEEFGIFLPGLPLDKAGIVAERIRTEVRGQPVADSAQDTHLSVSIGGSGFLGDVSYEALFSQADKNLYVAKGAGRNRTVLQPFASAA